MTQLTLNPDNQIAFLGGVENLIVGTEYDITATHLRPGTRFVFKGRPDIALTKRPDGVPTRYTPVDAQITVVPPVVAPAVALPIEIYPFDVKDRLTASGLNSSFLPVAGGTITAGLTIENGNLNLGASLSINPDPTFAYITRQNQAVGHRRIGITGRSGPGFTEYPLEELRLNTGLMTCTGSATFTGDVTVNTLNTTGGGIQVYGHVNLRIPTTSPDKTIAYLARTNQTAGFRRIGITARDLPETYYPLEELWINATATTFTGSATFAGDVTVNTLNTVAGGLQVYGHVNLRVPATSTDKTIAYLARTNQTAGFRRLGITGRDLPETYYPLEELWINATTTTFTGALSVAGGLNVTGALNSGALNITGTLSTTGGITAGGTVQAPSIHSTGAVECDGTLHAIGAAYLQGGLTVVGEISGNDITTQTLHATSDVYIEGSLTVNGTIGGSADLSVAGAVHGGRVIAGSASPSVSAFDQTTGVGGGFWCAANKLVIGATDSAGGATGALMEFIPGLSDIITHADFYPDIDGYSFCGAGSSAWSSVASYSYITVSDLALKRDIKPVPTNCLSLVLAVEPKTYKLITTRKEEAERTHWGFLANDVADTTERAGYEFGGVREDNGVMGLAYNDMLAMLWGAVRELASQLSELKGTQHA